MCMFHFTYLSGLLSTLVENCTHEAKIFLRSKEVFLKANLQVLYLCTIESVIVKHRALSPKNHCTCGEI